MKFAREELGDEETQKKEETEAGKIIANTGRSSKTNDSYQSMLDANKSYLLH